MNSQRANRHGHFVLAAPHGFGIAKYTAPAKERVLVVEVLFPKKIDYFTTLQQVLNAFTSKTAALAIPHVRNYIENHPVEAEVLLEQLQKIVSGYSMYEVDGRFMTADGPIDERVLVLRFIVRDSTVLGLATREFHAIAELVIGHLIAGRLAKDLGMEQEVWMMSYRAELFRWVRGEKEET